MDVARDADLVFWLMFVFTFVGQGKFWMSHQAIYKECFKETKTYLLLIFTETN